MSESSTKILVVDDEATITDFVGFALQKEGYAADIVKSGEDAIAMAAQNDYDLFILDIMLPGMDGFEVITELRKKKHVKMVELTDYLPDSSILDGEASVLNQENKIEFYQAIHHLNELEREVVLYRITGELSFREIGEILGKSENWSRTIFYRAKQKMKKELNTYE